VACDKRSDPPRVAAATLTGDSVARISGAGGEPIDVSGATVVAIARVQHLSLAEARDRAIGDALFALEARRQKLDVGRSFEVDSVLARRLAESFVVDAKALGPVTDAEVEVATQKHWYDVARPESFMTVHAAVLVAPDASPDQLKRAEAVANAIRDAVLPLSPEGKTIPALPPPLNERIPNDGLSNRFRDALANIPKDGFDVRIEQLVPIARDSLSVLPNGRSGFAPEFAAAATGLKERGEVSPVVRSPFGFHVIMLLARYPGKEVDLAERRSRFVAEIYDTRARAMVADLLAKLHKNTNVELERNLDAQLAQIRVRDPKDMMAGGPKPSAAPSTPERAPAPPASSQE
jgi:peptidyl-prolyl cis-trans isomerase C